MLWILWVQIVDASKEILVKNPFYLRARIYDSHSANVQFEIAGETKYRTCQMYKFTVRRNREPVYSMEEQNLTYWRNSLELKDLAAGDYRVCAIICSEHLRQLKYHYENYLKKTNRTSPITACVNFQAFRPHLLILTLYILVFIFLVGSHTVYSLRKRQFQARMKMALVEVESTLQKWRSNPPPPPPTTEPTLSSTTLQNLVPLPTSPVEHSTLSSPPLVEQANSDEHQEIMFHLNNPNE